MNIYIKLFSQICLLLVVVVFSSACGTTSQKHLTERLFMENKRINISHLGSMPNQDSSKGAVVLSEQVTFTPPLEDTIDKLSSGEDESRLDTNKIYNIPQVTVVSHARFAPVREEYIDLEFVIHVPKEFLSDDYQLCLTPELLHNDSVVRLEDVVLRGKNFVEKQKSDYERYENYMSTVIDPSGYDTMFVNRRGVERELERRRRNEINQYYNRWSNIQEYRQWRSLEQEKFDAYNIRQSGKLRKKLMKHDNKYRTKFFRSLAAGRDSANLGREHREKRAAIIASAPVHKQLSLGTVPAKYREIYMSNIRLEDIEPLLPEEEDSVRIASEFVLHERIAANEVKGSRRDEVFRQIVPSPYRPDAHYNGMIGSDYDFIYRYSRQYPVNPGLKNLRLTLKGYITATDRSHYNIRKTDTLSFIISSIDELADGSLVANQKFTSEQRKEYIHALQLLHNREYQRALRTLNDYKDYNTVLTLTCMGYNNQAYDLLLQLEKTGRSHYLGAILSCRLEDYNRAIDHLKKSYRMDASWSYRSERDPEITKLIKTYGLQQELDAILYE